MAQNQKKGEDCSAIPVHNFTTALSLVREIKTLFSLTIIRENPLESKVPSSLHDTCMCEDLDEPDFYLTELDRSGCKFCSTFEKCISFRKEINCKLLVGKVIMKHVPESIMFCVVVLLKPAY